MSYFDPRSNYMPADMQRSYRIIRLAKGQRSYVTIGTFAGMRASLQGNSNYGEFGISVDAEERVNLDLDSDVAEGDILECVNDGQVWTAVSVRRQPTFRVVYLRRSDIETGSMPGQ